MATIVKKKTNDFRNLVFLLLLAVGLFLSVATAADFVHQMSTQSRIMNEGFSTLDASYRLTAEAPR